MNQLLYQASEVVFLAFPVVLLGLRMAKPNTMPSNNALQATSLALRARAAPERGRWASGEAT